MTGSSWILIATIAGAGLFTSLVCYRRSRLAEKKIRFLHNLLERATAGILIVSSERVIVEVNRRLCEMYGYQREELLGQSAAVFHLDQEAYERFGQWFENARNAGPQMQVEYHYRRKDGSTFWALISGGPLQLPDGDHGVVWSLTDITDRKQTEEQLALERNHLESLFETNGSGMLLVSSTRQILQVNHQFCALFGYMRDELVGQSARILHVDEQHYRDWAPRFQDARRGQPLASAEYPWRRKDGSTFWCFFAGVRIQLPDGEQGVLWNVIDISSLKEAQKQTALLTFALDSVYESCFLINQQAGFSYVNQEACRILGYSLEELKQMGVADVDPEFEPDRWPSLWQTLRQKPLLLESHHRTSNGDLIPVEINANYFEYQQQGYVLSLVRDISERLRQKALLQEISLRAEDASRAKSEFLANMSHEIRTPLNGISNLAHLLQDTDLSPEQRNYLSCMGSEITNILSLVSDILDISKIEAGKLVLDHTSFSIHEAVQGVASSQYMRLQQKQLHLAINLSAELPPCVGGDLLRFKQVLLNLLGNAIKFTEQGSITITVEVITDDGLSTVLQFCVTDTGIGIDPDMLKRLFVPFEQADSSTTRRYGGTGLGLSICRRLVELMGGKIWAESVPGQGSSFKVRLPFTVHSICSVDEAPVTRQDVPLSFRALSILLAEDNQVNAQSLRLILQRTGHTVFIAENGQKAFEAWQDRQWDCILMDVQMPVMDGVEALKHIRQAEHPYAQHTPIIALTAHAMKEDRQQLLTAGFDSYLSKPVDIEQLSDELQRLCR